MRKKYLAIKFIFFTLLFVVIIVSPSASQTPKGKTTNTSKATTTSSKTTTPSKTAGGKGAANTKNIKAKGIIAADMDCIVKVNGAAKTVNAKAFTASVVILNYGVNTIDATSTNPKTPASFKSTVTVNDTSRQVIEISFYDDSKFLDYIKQGKVDMVEMAIKKNPDLATNEGQIVASSPLQLAITSSQPAIVKLLMSKGASYKTPENIYPMHKAAIYASSKKEKDMTMAPDREMIDFFLTKGCKLTDKDDGGNTVLHAAVRGLKLDLVTYLVEKGMDINAKNDFGDTPIKIAEDKGAVSIIDFLKSKGAIDTKPE